jgi:hypothetical protein
MRSADDDHAVLNAVESQLRSEDPQIIACFMAFNSVTRPIRPPGDWDQPSADEILQPEDSLRHRHIVQLVIIVCTLAAVIAGIMMSVLTGPQST